ncbi:MAG: bifunctional folylpolyglutamate synthase/dihydrofolate synthase [Candidatus Thermoplasmatota archaeon]|nr:bifunctional folylpolyglutamate synthase/dihydrofolate synthase [Candidatus Thermoplasmatota archaeon]
MAKATRSQADEAIDWLYSFTKYGSKLGLDRITVLLEKMGNPHHHLRVIHVTGTNGKGSVCNYLGSVLTKAGYITGVYISPHLEDFSERIVIDGEMISTNDLVKHIRILQPFVAAMEKQGMVPTFFEIITALALYFFAEKQVDYAVVEVGLGGRFDATNVVSPLLSVITNISLEHTEILGNDVTAIAFEKAGIIKHNAPVITAAYAEALMIIQAVAQEKKAPLITVTRDMWRRTNHSLNAQEFIIRGSLKEYHVQTSLLGEYQGENLAVTVLAIEQLQLQGIYITDEDMIEGIRLARNPGRLEIIFHDPLVILDGAHNPSGMKSLATTVKHDFRYHRLIMVIGILRDKNIREMLRFINPLVDIFVVTQSTNPRACESQLLVEIIKDSGFLGEIKAFPLISDAVSYAFRSASSSDLICISGSLFTVGEARQFLHANMAKLSQKMH